MPRPATTLHPAPTRPLPPPSAPTPIRPRASAATRTAGDETRSVSPRPKDRNETGRATDPHFESARRRESPQRMRDSFPAPPPHRAVRSAEKPPPVRNTPHTIPPAPAAHPPTPP